MDTVEVLWDFDRYVNLDVDVDAESTVSLLLCCRRFLPDVEDEVLPASDKDDGWVFAAGV